MKHIGAAFVMAGILFAILAMPLVIERVPMNRWYGVRTARAFESAQNWYAINRVAGWWLITYGLTLVAVGFLPTLVPSVVLTTTYRLAPLLLIPLFLLPVLVYSRWLE